jgi:hypothetical protein
MVYGVASLVSLMYQGANLSSSETSHLRPTRLNRHIIFLEWLSVNDRARDCD